MQQLYFLLLRLVIYQQISNLLLHLLDLVSLISHLALMIINQIKLPLALLVQQSFQLCNLFLLFLYQLFLDLLIRFQPAYLFRIFEIG